MIAAEPPDRLARIRRDVYDGVITTGSLPSGAALAETSGLRVSEASDALRALAAARVLVLQPDSGEILMAPPFSAVPTPFLVETASYSTYGNCIWDAIGIGAMIGAPVLVRTSCGCCGESMRLEVANDYVTLRDVASPSPAPLVHFPIPAPRWWADIAFT